MAQFVNMFDVDLQKPTSPRPLRQIAGEGDANGLRVGARVTDGGEYIALGGTCVGKVIRADGATVQLTGTISGNQAYVVLDQTSCAVEGPLQVAVCWVSSSNVTTLLIAYGSVVNTQTGNAIQPSTPVPDLTELLAEISAMETATAAANAAAAGALANFAGAFSDAMAYTKGQYVTYTDGYFYRFKVDHAAGAWSSSDVEKVTAGGEIDELKSALSKNGEVNYYSGDQEFTLTVGGTRTKTINIETIQPGNYILSLKLSNVIGDADLTVQMFQDTTADGASIFSLQNGRAAARRTLTKNDNKIYFYLPSTAETGTSVTISEIAIKRDYYSNVADNDNSYVPYTSAVDYYLREKVNRYFVTPEMFGAKGDGVNDDTDAINDAIAFSIRNNVTILFRPLTIYSVSTVEIAEGLCCIDFNGCIFKANSSGPVLNVNPDSYNSDTPNGYIKNLKIDMNSIAEIGLYVIYSWRKIFDTISIDNPPKDGIAVHVDGSSSCAGNVFKNFRGRGNDKTGTIFIKIDAGDNTFDNCDFVNWQVGMELNSFSVVSNFHGFISQTALYSDSCFIKLNAGAQMSNLYPDTQRYVFGIGGYSLQISISNLVLVFNESIIGSSITDSKPPKVFEPDVSYAKTKNILITNMSVHAPIYTNSNVFSSGGSVGIAVINFAVGSNLNRYNIKCPGVSGDNATEKATFNSALYDGRPVIRPNGYIDVITATDDISENDVLCKFNLNGGWTPVESATPCIISDSTGENHRQRIVVTKKDESGKIAVYAPDNIETGEKLYVNIPAEFHPTTYT